MTTNDEDTYLVEDDTRVTKPKRRAAPAKADPKAVPVLGVNVAKETLTRIIIEPHDSIPPCGLSIGLNGRQWLVKPGRAVDVPPGILEVLDNAIYSAPVIDPDTLKVVDYTDRLRYTYRIVKGDKLAA
jgi:hypothetical protein